MHEMARIFTGESRVPIKKILFNGKLLGPYNGHVLAILGPYFGYFYNIYASILLKFSLKSQAWQIEEYS